MKKNLINIPNVLTFSRIVLGFIFLFLFLSIHNKSISNINILIIQIILMIVYIIAIITDGLDGYFARKSKNVTDFGKHFDPLSDSIFFIIVFSTFLILKLMPWYFFAVILFREGFMHIFLRPFFKKKGKSLPANIFGKTKTFFQSIFSLILLAGLILERIFIIYLSDNKTIETYNFIILILAYIFFAIIAFLSVFSLITYMIHFKD